MDFDLEYFCAVITTRRDTSGAVKLIGELAHELHLKYKSSYQERAHDGDPSK